MTYRLKIYGTRGSIATSKTSAGKTTQYFGTETSCISFENNTKAVILDSGTGFRNYNGPNDILLLYTHAHDDHTAGLGFNPRVYNPTVNIDIKASSEHLDALLRHYDYENRMFPMDLANMAGIKSKQIIEEQFETNELHIEKFVLNHPQTSYGYVLTFDTAKVAILYDHEHDLELEKITGGDERIIDKIYGSDIVLADACYTAEEYDPEQIGKTGFSRVGWGHSTDEKMARICRMADCGLILLTHHDPSHDDEMLRKREYQIQKKLNTDKIFFATEGSSYLLDPRYLVNLKN